MLRAMDGLDGESADLEHPPEILTTVPNSDNGAERIAPCIQTL
jgi:hypothetical protein